MKKFVSLFLVLLLCTSLVYASAEPVRVMGLKGPTTIGMLNLIDSEETAEKYSFEAVGSADEIVANLTSGKVDIAAVPANLASVLYNKTKGQIRVIDINTLGVLYLVQVGQDIETVSDLKGKEIYMTGKGTTPEYALRYVLSKNGLDPDKDVTLTFKSEATEVLAYVKAGEATLALLPQPFATAALSQVEGLCYALDLGQEWDAVNPDFNMVTGVTVARNDFIKDNEDKVKEFLADHKKSVEYVTNEENKDVAQLTEKYIGIKAPIAEKAIPMCHIEYIDGADMQKKLSGYLQTLFDADPKSVGGALPAEDFYVSFE